MKITSKDNALLKRARAVRDGKDEDLIYVEGLRLCEEALKSQLPIEAVIFSEELVGKPRAAQVIEQLSEVAAKNAEISERLLESISFTKTPQGVVVLAQRPRSTEQQLSKKLKTNSLLVVLHEINNPVNVGAILRTAEAAGVTGVITTKNTSDPFSAKSLRGAMGSAFRLPVWTGPTFNRVIEWCSKKSIFSVCADAEAELSYVDFNWKQPVALILGPESNGLTDEEIKLAGQALKIPMSGEVESLNVSVAAGVMLYEAARQRS